MEKEANKISAKRLFIILSTEMFAMTSLIFPAITVGFAGKNGLPVMLFASGLFLFLAVIFLSAIKGVDKSPDLILEEKNWGMSAWFIKASYLIRYFMHSLLLILIFGNLIQEVLLPEWNLFWILLPMFLLSFIMGGKDLKIRGRILENLFPAIFLPLLLVLAIALFHLDYSSLPAQLWQKNVLEPDNILGGVYGVFLFYQPVEFLLFLVPALEPVKKGTLSGASFVSKDRKRTEYDRRSRIVGAACMFVILINILMYISTIGLFGAAAAGDKLWSALYIMQSVRLPGKFVERLDILFLVFWIFSMFALFTAYMYYAGRFVIKEKEGENCLGVKSEKLNRKKRVYAGIWLGLLFAAAFIIRESEKFFPFFISYKMWLDFPCALFLVFLLYRKKGEKSRKKNAIKRIMTGMVCLFLLTGCHRGTDIEDKNYAMTLAVEAGKEKNYVVTYEIADLSCANQEGKGRKSRLLTYEADSLKDAEEMYRARNDKVLDFGHLKAILCSREMLEGTMGDRDVLKELKADPAIAGTVYVFQAEEKVENILELGGEKASSFGEYMESMVSNRRQGENTSTLADVLREKEQPKTQVWIGSIRIEKEELVLEPVGIQLGEKEFLGNIVRFHIRANSNEQEDQLAKTAIKDRILPKLQELLAPCQTKKECLDKMDQSISLIEEMADQACKEENCDYDTRAYLCRELFPLKKYGDLILPCSMYDALRIDLGKGDGSNWWCMMYPSLCMKEGVIEEIPKEEQEKIKKEIEKNENICLEQDGKQYYVKWWLADWIKQIGSFFQDKLE